LPEGVRRDTREAEAETAHNTGTVLCVALNYGGRAEIVDAVNRILQERGSPATPTSRKKSLPEKMYTAGLPDPDLLIRTMRRNARKQFSALADCVCGNLCHRDSVAGF